MYSLKDFAPFYATAADHTPKVITFTYVDNEEIATWMPSTQHSKVLNEPRFSAGHLVQLSAGMGWHADMQKLEPMLRFIPDDTGYFLVNESWRSVSRVKFDGTAWHIVAWDLVATDANGNDIGFDAVQQCLKKAQPFFICDKLTWQNGDDENQRVQTKHGYEHYEK
ncbi:hypothetical protein LJ739_13120 [Aestuariibacter halophilus]|uniref:Polyketide cyclase n=1 Tax=Fluctibacter halophilus TaxID=226011 RepID=A0ABS8G9L2_9ALTE|nr:hypothetical protein [Aestuariibacter halophilus]MCC2617188.1 hypothetical protein [Aestuariibacter halophilus]